MKTLIATLVAPIILLAANQALAFDWTTRELVSQAFDVPGGQSRSIALNGSYQIKNLVVQARPANRDGGIVDVLVNGEVKGTIYVPGTDPSYIVTVGEGASSIEFISRTTATIRIDRIIGTVSNSSGYPKNFDPVALLMPKNEVTELSRLAIRTVDSLMNWTTADNNEKYLLPIKTSSGRLYAIASSRGELSAKTARAIHALITQFDLAQTFFDKSLTCNECFNDVIQLLAIRERFDKAIQ